MSAASNGGRDREIDMLADVSRACGLAQALASPIVKEPREGSVVEVASEIVFLLERTREELLRGL